MRNIAMKKYFIYIIFFTFGSSLAQDKKPKRILTQQGEIIKFEEYHDNGILSQTGYFLDGKNHGIWMSYNSQGIKLSKGVYDKGKKTDRWFFWNEGILIEVDYKDNIVQSATKWDKVESLASKDD